MWKNVDIPLAGFTRRAKSPSQPVTLPKSITFYKTPGIILKQNNVNDNFIFV